MIMTLVTHLNFHVDVNANSSEYDLLCDDDDDDDEGDHNFDADNLDADIINYFEMEVAPCVLHVFIGTPRNRSTVRILNKPTVQKKQR